MQSRIYPSALSLNMRGIQEFSSGRGPSQSDIKNSNNVFFLFVFFSPQLILQKSFSKKSIIFQGSRGGPTFPRGGGPTFSSGGGVHLLIPSRNPYNL